MRYINILLLIFFQSYLCFVGLTQDQMNNGGFETIDNNIPYPGYGYAIEYAPPWKSIYGSADICSSLVPQGLVGTAHQGQGMMRLGHLSEYAQGVTYNLTAGTTYEISFWAQIRFSSPYYLRNLGMMIGTTDYSNGFNPEADFDPQLVFEIGTGWTNSSYCFTAQESGVHYVVLGGKCDPIPGENAGYFTYNIDDVKVTVVSENSGVPIANISTTQTQYCEDDNIVLDGTLSSNETGHHWVIERKLSNGEYACLYNQSDQNGQASLFDVSAAFASVSHVPTYGSCYRAYLFTSNDCDARDRLDFCIIDPRINFISDGNPVCEGDLVDLEVTGDNGWTYTWSDGSGQLASGVGEKTLQVTPEVGNSTYTVVVTTPEGCTHTETLTLTVHTDDNLAPWMNGINGSGEYTYYVQAGQSFSFTSNVLNDNSNESLIYSTIDNIPTSITHNISPPPTGQNGGVMNFSMTTSISDQGVYNFSLVADDQNSCLAGIDTFKFIIIVVCDQCPICINYENRTPSGTPLPSETKVGKCIEAGLTQPVSTGDANVLFQAGESIDLGVLFEAGPGYEAIIDPTTCVTDCEDCCEDWAGFTYDELPNPFYMNFNDSDPTNDFIQVTDTYHPFCAFNITGYSFVILDGNQNVMNNGITAESSGFCCSFESPAPENPIAHSSIWWNGYTTNIFGNQVHPNDGVYYYVLKLYGCNGAYEEHHGYVSIGGIPPSGMATSNTGLTANNTAMEISELEQSEITEAIHCVAALRGAERAKLEAEIELSPNPTTDIVRIIGADENVSYQLFDDKSTMLTRKETAVNGQFSMSKYSSGTYYVWIFSEGTYVIKKLVKL